MSARASTERFSRAARLAGARAPVVALGLAFAAFALAACGGKPAKEPRKEEAEDPTIALIEAEKGTGERGGDKSGEKGSGEKRSSPGEDAPSGKGPVYPAPFSWEEIRGATKSGRTYRFKVQERGKPARERVLTFVKVDDDGCEVFAGGDSPRRMGWPQFQKDAEFPKDRVTTREETVKLPGGKFDCMVYEVRGKDGEVSTYYFARTLPGAPVLFYVEQDGKRVRTTTLLEHIPGKG